MMVVANRGLGWWAMNDSDILKQFIVGYRGKKMKTEKQKAQFKQ